MKFKKTVLSIAVFTIVNGVATDVTQASIVFDKKIHEYNESVVPTTQVELIEGRPGYDNDQFAVYFDPMDDIKNTYIFNKGGVLNNLAVYGGLNHVGIDVQSDKESTLTIGNLYGHAIWLKVGAIAKITGGDIFFGTPVSDAIVVEVDGGSELTVSGDNVTLAHGYNGLTVQWNEDLKFEHTSVFKANTENDFTINTENSTFGIYAYSGQTGATSIDIDSKHDIIIEANNDVSGGKGADIGIGAVTSPYIDYEGLDFFGKNYINLSAKNKILISGYSDGIRTWDGGSTIGLQSNEIIISTKETGIFNQKRTSNVKQDSIISLKASRISIDSPIRAIYTYSEGPTTLVADERISLNYDGSPQGTTLQARNPNVVLAINKDQSRKGQLLLTGGISAYNLATVDVSGGNNSVVTGWTSEAKPKENDLNDSDFDHIPDVDGTVNLSLGKNSKWILTNNSTLTSLELNQSIIDFSSYQEIQKGYTGIGAAHQYRKLTTKNFLGTGNTLDMRVDLVNESTDKKLVDQLIVTERVEGQHIGRIWFDNVGPTEKSHTINWLVSQENGSMTITAPDGGNKFAAPGALTYWALKFVDQNTNLEALTFDELKALPNEGVGKGNWYLVRVDKPVEPDPNPDPNPNPGPSPEGKPDPVPEVLDNLTLGTSTGQALAYFADLEDLRKRIGEVRYGAQTGAWAKVFAKDEKVSQAATGFDQKSYGINVGFDTVVSKIDQSSWLIGGAFRYGKADQEGLGGRTLDGELEEYSVKGYATWMHDSGSYADFVLQLGRYHQELNGIDNMKTGKSFADYNTWGYGASVEVGHMFTVLDSQNNHWFTEPQFELSYFRAQGKSYQTSTGLRVNQSNADFLTGRLGVVLGKKFNFGTVDGKDSRWVQIAALGGVKHEFLGGDQTVHYTGLDKKAMAMKADDFARTRFYYGVNADWQVAENLRMYAEVEREKGDGYTKSWDASLGFKYMF